MKKLIMKKLIMVGLFVAVLSFGLSGVVKAAEIPPIAMTDVTASATVVNPLVIDKNYDLLFGYIAQGVTATITPAVGGFDGSAMVTVTGHPGKSITVSVPATVTVVHETDPAQTMTVHLDHVATSGSQIIDATGIWVVEIGGSVTAATDQLPGAYSGTFVVSAMYL